jgi:hypothetical protein
MSTGGTKATTCCAARAAGIASSPDAAKISSLGVAGPTTFMAATATTGFSPVAETTASGAADSVDCGSGIDRAVIHSEDNEVNCEDVKVIS